MKKLILVSLILTVLGCNKFTALQEPVTSAVTSTFIATQPITTDILPLPAGCLIELLTSPVDGGLMINEQTGDFSYVFQNLSVKIKNQDQFAYREICNGEYSYVKIVLIDTKALSTIDAF